MIESILNLNPILVIILLTFFPFLELRASIPYGIITLGQSNWFLVVIIAIITNILLAPILYFLLENFLHFFLRIKFFKKFWDKIIIKTQKKVHSYIERWGVLGLSIFIGIPLPGSGVYSGAIAAYLLGYEKKDFYKATILGVLMAAIIVTIVVLSGMSSFDFLVKNI